MSEMDYPYRLVYYKKDRIFTLSKKEYLGKKKNDGVERDHYKYNMLFNGRSQEMKDRIERRKGKGIPPIITTTNRGEIEYAAESDEDAIRGVVELVFEYPEELGVKK